MAVKLPYPLPRNQGKYDRAGGIAFLAL